MKKFCVFVCFVLWGLACAQEEQIVLNEGETLVEMVDHKRGIIIGYMVLKNGNITKQVRFSQPKAIIQTPPSDNALQNPQNLPQNPQNPQNLQGVQNPQALQGVQNPQTAQNPQDLATQSEYEKQVSQKPKKKKQSWFAKRKKAASKPKQPRHITENMIDSSAIPQESGAESHELNEVYKNRQWDKSKIPHNIKSEVINLGD